jgi:hypothetical protein
MISVSDRQLRIVAAAADACLPRPATQPSARPGWIHEIKHDGFRILTHRRGDRVRLLTRNGYDFADRFRLAVAVGDGIVEFALVPLPRLDLPAQHRGSAARGGLPEGNVRVPASLGWDENPWHTYHGRPNGLRQRQATSALRPGQAFGRCRSPQ